MYCSDNNTPDVMFQDRSLLNFNRTNTATFCRMLWSTDNTDQWYMNYTASAGDITFRGAGLADDSIKIFGGNGIIRFPGTWNGVRTRIGNVNIYEDPDGNLRSTNGAPTGERDGKLMGGPRNQYTTTTLPPATNFKGEFVFISDHSGKPSFMVCSNGTAWFYLDNTAV